MGVAVGVPKTSAEADPFVWRLELVVGVPHRQLIGVVLALSFSH